METMQEQIDFITARFPDAYAFQWSLHGWVIKSVLCGQIGLYRKTEQEAWDACYELLKARDEKRNLQHKKVNQ